MLKKTKKISLWIVVLSQIFLLNAPMALAGISIPSASSIAAQLEQRYHLNVGSIQDMGEGFNVSSTKTNTPEVDIFFDPASPKQGEKITATALPMYFSNPNESLYYTWYVKHNNGDPVGADSEGRKTSNGNTDWNDDDDIDIEDWKIEAARFLVQGRWSPKLDTDGDGNNDYANNAAWYDDQDDSDADGYKAMQGGDNKSGMPDHCYLHDFTGGKNYEIAEFDGGTDIDCAVAAHNHLCGTTVEGVEAANFNPDLNFNQNAFSTFESCRATTEIPICFGGTPVCSVGTAVCGVSANGVIDSDSSCASLASPVCSGEDVTLSTHCKAGVEGGHKYEHLFPRPDKTGDGTFGEDEEEFWGTDPNDPDTGSNGMNDEATIVGLGQDTLTWNYQVGDQVGVVIEGTSMLPTKYSDGSMMIMWALVENKCSIGPTGTYVQNIKGYNVSIPVTAKDINSCLESNLIDPAEGGQADGLEVGLSYSPENPVNDPSGDEMGDVIVAQSSISNTTQDESEIQYDWTIEISDNGNFSSANWTDISDELGGLKEKKGNGLSSIEFQLNLSDGNFPAAADYDNAFPNGVGYVRVRVVAREYFGSGKYREGYSDAIIKVTSSAEKIEAYSVKNSGIPGSPNLDLDGVICNEDLAKRSVCFVAKNEIIGVGIDPNIDGVGGDDLDNFSWTIDGASLSCDTEMSALCDDSKQTSVNFFPVTKNSGETYTIGLTANNITTGQMVSLVRTFKIIDPYVKIVSIDNNKCWSKLLGTYEDLEGNTYSDYSDAVLQAISGSEVGLKAEFHPAWIETSSSNEWQSEWLLDGLTSGITMIADSNGDGVGDTITFDVTAVNGGSHNVSFSASYNKDKDYRRAMKEIWGISQFDSADQYVASSIKLESFADPEAIAKGPMKFMASVVSNLPGQIMFLLRIVLTMFMIIFVSGMVFSLNPRIKND